jgi:hypothetical protein
MSNDRDLRSDVDGYVPQVQLLYPVEAPIGGGDGVLRVRRTDESTAIEGMRCRELLEEHLVFNELRSLTPLLSLFGFIERS